MAEVDGQEKTEQPTGKKLKESREKGEVAKSLEINSLAILASGLMLLLFTQQFIGNKLLNMSKYIFGSLDILNINIDSVRLFAAKGILFFFITLAPVILGLFIVSIISGASQVGLKFSSKALAPKFSKFNPINGFKNAFFSSKSFVELIKSILKFLIIGTFAYSIIQAFVKESFSLIEFTVPQITDFMFDSAYSLLWKIVLVFTAIAALDFIFQKYKFKKDMMMTKQEVKEENKQTEGNPLVKSRIRKVQVSMAKNRMMKEVPKADVIITNPTHYAIALKYEMNKNSAPLVLAKGVDLVAQKIKQIGIENNIPLHEDRELARALYKHCEIGDQIPQQLFRAVAQVLAYVYQLKNSKINKSIV